MHNTIKIGTRDSQLAIWQAETVKELLETSGHSAELIFIKSEGDTDLSTPLYEIGVQGIFTRSLDIALLKGDIDIAVHSMKDVPTQMAKGVRQAAVLPRASTADILVPKPGEVFNPAHLSPTIATSSIRRKAQWLNKYPASAIDNLRGNVNTRLRKLEESNWDGAIFAAAGLERIGLRPQNAIDLDWMLPAPAQGAIVVVCRDIDTETQMACAAFNDSCTELCTAIERDFLKALMGGCSTPISALAKVVDDNVVFEGNVASPDGKQMAVVNMTVPYGDAANLGSLAATAILENGGRQIVALFRNEK